MPRTLEIIAPRSAADERVGRAVCAALQRRIPRTRLRLTGAHVTVTVPWQGKDDLELALAATTVWNYRLLQLRPLPWIYDAGVVYRREPHCGDRHCEEFLTAHEVMRRGGGDCDDLGPFLAAQLMLKGERARAFAQRSSVGWHIPVRRGDGTIEDPSAELGMKGDA